MASEFRDLVVKAPWFQKLVDEKAQERAMELLGELVDGEEESADGKPSEVETLPLSQPMEDKPGKLSAKYRFRWHNANGRNGITEHMYATGPNGERVEVKKGDRRTESGNYWWVYYVDSVRKGRCYTARDARLTVEYEITKKGQA